MLHLLLGRDQKANSREILSRIARDVHGRKPGRVLMVPELISHDTERELCRWAGDTASRYAEVLSFTRLVRRVAEETGGQPQCLDGGGRVAAMASVCRQLSSRLKSYAAVETKPEFLTKLIDAVDEFKRCRITPDDLRFASESTEGSFAQKLEELSLIMEAYDALCARGKRDPRDQMSWLQERLEEGAYAGEHVFYIDGFPDFTRQHMAILDCLMRRSTQVTVSVNCDHPGSRQLAFEKGGQTASQILQLARKAGVEVSLEVIPEPDDPLRPLRERLFQGELEPGGLTGRVQAVRARSVWQECVFAAGKIASLVRAGCRYRDITLVCTDMDRYGPIAQMVCRRIHIPLYRSGTEDILKKPMIATVLTALDAASGGLERRSVMEYLRSGLSPMDEDTCDLVDNYTFLWNIRGDGWTQQWKNSPEGLVDKDDRQGWERAVGPLETLNRARQEAIAPLDRLHRGLESATDLKGQISALYRFLEDVSLESRMENQAKELEAAGESREAQILSQLWEILVSALEQMYDVLGDTHWETEHFARLLRLLLSQYDVGTIPPVLDAVQMGTVSAMRCRREKHLIILGGEEGSFPGYSGSTGLLSDQERIALRSLGVPLTGGAMEGIQSEFAEIYGVISGAEETVTVLCSGEQPSFLYRRIAQLAGGESPAETAMDLAPGDPEEAGAWLAQWEVPELARSLGAEKRYRQVRAQGQTALGEVTPEGIRRLYGKKLNLSASKIDTQATCRLRYFLQYGIRAKERKEVTLDPAEFGTYVHAVMERMVRSVMDRGGFHRVTEADTLELAHTASDYYIENRFGAMESQRMKTVFSRNRQELDLIVRELWRELSASGFAPHGMELKFGSGPENLPAIDLPNDAIPASLEGIIDRVDLWRGENREYYRVVDYKTGKKNFDYCDIYNGIGLQMLLYLFALDSSGWNAMPADAVAAGVQYFPARAPYLSTGDGEPDMEQIEKERQKQFHRKGMLLDDDRVLDAMEEGRQSLSDCELVDGSRMRMLKKYVFQVLKNLVEEIASGNVKANPYSRGSSFRACDYCPYGSICREVPPEQERNFKAVPAHVFWEDVEKEVQGHG